MELDALGTYENHPEVLRAIEKFYAEIEGITGGVELPCEQLEAIAKQSLSRKSVRSTRGPNSWNNFVKDMQQTLSSETKEVGLNTRYLSTLWSQLSADKKQQYRRGRRPRMKSKTQRIQLRRAISHLRGKVEDISKLGADVLLFVCDNKKRSQGGGLSSAIGSPQAVRFTQWMEKHRVGFIDFKRFCKGEELFFSHHGDKDFEELEDRSLSRLNKGIDSLSRDESRSQLNASLLLMFNKAVGREDKLQRLPQTKKWAEWMEVRGLNLVIETPNITRSDLEERLQGKIGIAKVKAMISGIKKGDIRFQNIGFDPPLDC